MTAIESLLVAIRDAPWLDRQRVRAYSGLVAVAMLVCVGGFAWAVVVSARSDPGLRPWVTDFDAFWSGGYLADHGEPQAAYDGDRLNATEHIGAMMATGTILPFAYPPTFLLLCAALAWLPYLASAVAFESAFFALLLLCLRRLAGGVVPMVAMLGFPGMMINAVTMQNGFVFASCFASAALLLNRHPRAAGLILGVLILKPHLAIGVPVALIAARRWSALTGFVGGAAVLTLLSWIAFGTRTWLAFLATTPGAWSFLEQRPEIWTKFITIYGAVRVLHGSAAFSYATQVTAAIAALGCLAWILRQRPGAGAEISALITATFLSTPHGMDYDLVCLAVPIVWIAREAIETGWRQWEKIVLASAYLLPAFTRYMTAHSGVPFAPLVMAALFSVTLARAYARPPKQKQAVLF